ncbi:DNA-binding transcriptional regulator, LysR family [Luteibacter sp. UNC138MFCol5.1]|uniref:LysR family transcriptional regulator n=1 Tax=Luteibacter sp. UNC138MFCol5.1 TaxID=1502774 RepID=UPI0008C6DFE3|nr:LysR family transcriptional regulator [Luteibacter sp. UNC138MFCol5.1]SEO58336.1 DNA-binding transcriptional regulator, LysR family [Luteibacter sp. UNC138MFCol5.1]
MDRLQAMAIFLAVVEEGGFASAARKLELSAPMATRAVSELENAMGVRLLTRTTRVVRVTETGARYANDCRRILADVAESEEAAAGSHGEVRGRLVVTASSVFGPMRVTPIVTEYLRRYPEAEVECRFVDRVVNMIDEGVDVAVRIGPLQDSAYQARCVGRVRRVVCASPCYVARHGAPSSPADLVDHTVVMANGITPSVDWRFVVGDQATVVRVRPRMTVSSNEAAIGAALAGFGLTRVVSYMVDDHLASGRLVEVLRDHESVPLPVHVLHHEGRHAARKVRAFVDLASQSLRDDRLLHWQADARMAHGD